MSKFEGLTGTFENSEFHFPPSNRNWEDFWQNRLTFNAAAGRIYLTALSCSEIISRLLRSTWNYSSLGLQSTCVAHVVWAVMIIILQNVWDALIPFQHMITVNACQEDRGRAKKSWVCFITHLTSRWDFLNGWWSSIQNGGAMGCLRSAYNGVNMALAEPEHHLCVR